jgi:hypothetical protein
VGTGSVLDGPAREALLAPAAQLLPALITMMASRVVALQDTAAWVVGCISELLSEAIDPVLDAVMGAVLQALQGRPSVANSASWVPRAHGSRVTHTTTLTLGYRGGGGRPQTVLNLSDFYDHMDSNGAYLRSSRLSSYYPSLVTTLVNAANRYRRRVRRHVGLCVLCMLMRLGPVGASGRSDALSHNLRVGALNALTALVETSADVRMRRSDAPAYVADRAAAGGAV